MIRRHANYKSHPSPTSFLKSAWTRVILFPTDYTLIIHNGQEVAQIFSAKVIIIRLEVMWYDRIGLVIGDLLLQATHIYYLPSLTCLILNSGHQHIFQMALLLSFSPCMYISSLCHLEWSWIIIVLGRVHINEQIFYLF